MYGIFINDDYYPCDTLDEVKAAAQALADAGEEEATVWAGAADGLDSYKTLAKVFARATHYTTWGAVRGGCGHEHRTQRTADRCIERDHRYVQRCNHSTTAHSDRKIYASNDPFRLAPLLPRSSYPSLYLGDSRELPLDCLGTLPESSLEDACD